MSLNFNKRTKYRLKFNHCLWAGLFIFAASQPVSAQRYNFFDTGSGNWNTSELWSWGVPEEGHEVYIGGTTARTATVSTNDAISTFAYIGYKKGENGTVNITGADALWQNQIEVFVGMEGQGSLNITNGGKLKSSGLIIGTTIGTASVHGANSSMELSNLDVGTFGKGTLNIEAGAIVNSGSATIGDCEGGTGVINVRGGSLLEIQQELSLGEIGIGTLNIETGKVTTRTVRIGNGQFNLRGSNSLLETTEIVFGREDRNGFGELGVANLNIEQGARVLSYGANVAHGILTVKGTGSLWENSSTMNIHNSGALRIEKGGKVSSSTRSIIGDEGAGEVTVTGAGSLWECSELVIGDGSGPGKLTIENGGKVSTHDQTTLGSNGGSGMVTVTGAGSVWESEFINIGDQGGSGILTVENGGKIHGEYITIGPDPTSQGTINLNGTAGARGVLEIMGISGRPGNNTLVFKGGILRATASSTDFISGFEVGDVTLDAGGGTIDSNGFDIGVSVAMTGTGGLSKEGLGTLALSGANTYTGSTYVRKGTLAVVGGASIKNKPGHTIVGQLAGENGTLWIDAGATVADAQGILGSSMGSQGTAKVNGTWIHSDKLRIGNEGTGTLLIENGGLVSGSTTELGTYASGIGSLTVNGVAGNRGVLLTGSITEKAGNGKLTLNGGVLRAVGDSTAFIKDFEPGEVTLGAGGGTIDSNGHNITVVSALGGTGSFSKEGTGSLKLSAVNTYTGGTLVKNGTLEVISGSSISHGAKNTVVGQLAGDNGKLIIGSGAKVTDSEGILGSSLGAQGTASIDGNWTNTGKVRVGNSGSGTLTIQNGGLVSATTVELGTYSTGTGNLVVKGVSGRRGVLLTSSIVERDGNGTLTVNGGVLKASADNAGFVKNFEAGEFTLGNGGGFIDSNGHSIAITSGISGTGALTKQGAGTLKLSGANTHTGGTVLAEGTLLVASSTALGNGDVTLTSGTLGTDGVRHQINVADDLVWNTGALIALTVTPNSNSEKVVVAGGLSKVGSGQLIFDLSPAGLPPGHTNFLVMTVAEGFGGLTVGDFGYVTGVSGFDGVFRISGTQLWFDDDYVPSLSASSFASSTSVTTVPEPSTWMLLGLGFGMVFWLGKSRHRA